MLAVFCLKPRIMQPACSLTQSWNGAPSTVRLSPPSGHQPNICCGILSQKCAILLVSSQNCHICHISAQCVQPSQSIGSFIVSIYPAVDVYLQNDLVLSAEASLSMPTLPQQGSWPKHIDGSWPDVLIAPGERQADCHTREGPRHIKKANEIP